MNENARLSLKGLVTLFERLSILEIEDERGMRLNKETEKLEEYCEESQYKRLFEEWGATKDDFYEWSVSNFNNPPTAELLIKIISYCKNKRDEYLAHDTVELREFETAINDYFYYCSLPKTSQDEGASQKDTEHESSDEKVM